MVVIGGGINGIGAYRELALQGLRVLLVERNDFCSGCSSAPSRMIHGGLRYLENGEFDLVRESLQERDALLRNAPHLVRPLPTVIPITSVFSGLFNAAASFVGWQGKPSSRGALPIKLGLSLYDWVTRNRRVLPRHNFNLQSTTRKLWPGLTPAARRSAVYYDAWISHPERLCIELLRDVVQASAQSVALNYCEITQKEGVVTMFDQRGDELFELRPKVIVNATGAWLDDTVQALSGNAAGRLVSGTKGSHLIIDNPDLMQALGGHMAYFENTDGRVCIVFPYLGKVLAGATDIRVDRATRVRCETDELEYILGSLRLVFPEIAVTPDQVVFSYSGIRPLPHSDQYFTGRISRGHHTKRLDGPVPQFCMIGGKWTTFRAFAEQTADQVMGALNHTRRLSTLELPIGGGHGFPTDRRALEQQLQADFGIPTERAAHLVDHYGTQAADVARHCQATAQDAPLVPDCAYTQAEVDWLLRSEFVETLSDVILRRTGLAITGAISMEVIEAVSDIMLQARSLGPADMARQQTTLIEELAEYHGVTSDALTARNKERSRECVLAAKPA
ncbi:Aerobic glycerol-3-phosphate dehydrogenase [Falsiruegeria litorea R37]|uniref:Aerobic glycerol-3-phosphate dehydrogenase n=1 Tax=Falsiruegeria litorea R37 TaxID=1200284 RepID=A0A1Y5TTM0_9RHOB|nr:glycerol-3-phosphate dehydrogenase/oxidase [Falsiruegeria litorea]SLN71842.1 Aerobic glycerol-3-phosphate dehydrogenase [Falsiruegeria litorea R37]